MVVIKTEMGRIRKAPTSATVGATGPRSSTRAPNLTTV